MRIGLVVLLIFGLCSLAYADTAENEIGDLLSAIASSECVFIRNGKEHSATEAADHLRMKYKRGRKWAKTAEDFIERLATKSSWSGKAYSMRCPGEDEIATAVWLSDALGRIRGNSP